MLRHSFRAALLAGSLVVGWAGGAAAQTPREEYLKPLTPDNAAFLFIDNQTKLMMAVQSVDHTVLMRNTEGLARLAAVFKAPVVLTTTGGGANGPAGALYPAITQTFPNAPVIDRLLYFNAMSDPAFAAAVKKTGKKKVILSGISTDYCLVYPAQSRRRTSAEGKHRSKAELLNVRYGSAANITVASKSLSEVACSLIIAVNADAGNAGPF